MAIRRLLILTLPLLGLISGPAIAADACTWAQQSDGSSFGVCNEDKKAVYCLSCPTSGGACGRGQIEMLNDHRRNARCRVDAVEQ
jgi:hypothetical protein